MQAMAREQRRTLPTCTEKLSYKQSQTSITSWGAIVTGWLQSNTSARTTPLGGGSAATAAAAAAASMLPKVLPLRTLHLLLQRCCLCCCRLRRRQPNNVPRRRRPRFLQPLFAAVAALPGVRLLQLLYVGFDRVAAGLAEMRQTSKLSRGMVDALVRCAPQGWRLEASKAAASRE